MSSKNHWEKIYATKQPDEVSWTQAIPQTSLNMIRQIALPKSARIIDIGGGDSTLVDHLVDLGYEDITVLDISRSALDRAKKRLGDKSSGIIWIESDMLDFIPTEKYDFWHDRAAFHFLVEKKDIDTYIRIMSAAVSGYVLISTFSVQGPRKCSGLDVRQYDEKQLNNTIGMGFEKISCLTEDHQTPFNTVQNFLFCCFKRVQNSNEPVTF